MTSLTDVCAANLDRRIEFLAFWTSLQEPVLYRLGRNGSQVAIFSKRRDRCGCGFVLEAKL
jgi:hypothetical protein